VLVGLFRPLFQTPLLSLETEGGGGGTVPICAYFWGWGEEEKKRNSKIHFKANCVANKTTPKLC